MKTSFYDLKKHYAVELILLCVLLLCYAAQSIYWDSMLGRFTLDCVSYHHESRIPVMYNLLNRFDIDTFLGTIKNNPYPPLHTLTQTLFSIVFNRNKMMMNSASNTPYLLMLLIFGYLLGRKMKDRATGLLFIVLVSLLPLVYGTFSTASLDFPLMGLIVMSVYMLLEAKTFSNRKWSLLFAFSVGWGMMVKETYLLYVIGPVLFMLLVLIKNHKQLDHKNTALNALLCASIVLIMVFPYYCLPGYGNRVLLEGPLLCYVPALWYDYENWRFLTTGIYDSLLTLPIFILFLAGLRLFTSNIHSQIKGVMIFWIIVPGVYILFMPHFKTARYLMPVLPALALIAAVGARYLLDKWLGRVIVVVIILIGIAQYFVINYYKNPYVVHENSQNRKYVYYRYTDINAPFHEKNRRNKYLKQIYSNIDRIEASKSAKKELNIFLPCYVQEYWDAAVMDRDRWFQNKARMNITNTVYSGLKVIREVCGNINKYDGVLFTVRKNNVKYFNGSSMSFKVLLDTYAETMLMHAPSDENMSAMEIDEIEALWNKISEYFSVHELIYQDDDFAIYIYTKKQHDSDI